MSDSGCLGALFSLKPDRKTDQVILARMPYRVCDSLLTPAELSFYKALLIAIEDRYTVCCKVRMIDVFFLLFGESSGKYRAKIMQKHIDFVLCDKETMCPICGIELDDRSHHRASRQERDEFVNGVFESAGLPLARVVGASSYNTDDLGNYLLNVIGGFRPKTKSNVVGLRVVEPTGDVPVCPKCGIPMVRRKSQHGAFWGCTNYPNCRQIINK